MRIFILFLGFLILITSCTEAQNRPREAPQELPNLKPLVSHLPKEISDKILASPGEFIKDVQPLLSDPLLILVDKKNPLPSTYAPEDLISLNSLHLKVSRLDLSLRKVIIPGILALVDGAKEDGVTLVWSSTYRSWTYQKQVFDRYAARDGAEKANTYSARPGESQHQLGTVADFGDITLEFANTKAGKWMAKHAGEYGWSLSFPKGYEEITGYQYEPWHFRFIGIEACKVQKKWFGDIQQYMMEFLQGLKEI